MRGTCWKITNFLFFFYFTNMVACVHLWSGIWENLGSVVKAKVSFLRILILGKINSIEKKLYLMIVAVTIFAKKNKKTWFVGSPLVDVENKLYSKGHLQLNACLRSFIYYDKTLFFALPLVMVVLNFLWPQISLSKPCLNLGNTKIHMNISTLNIIQVYVYIFL